MSIDARVRRKVERGVNWLDHKGMGLVISIRDDFWPGDRDRWMLAIFPTFGFGKITPKLLETLKLTMEDMVNFGFFLRIQDCKNPQLFKRECYLLREKFLDVRDARLRATEVEARRRREEFVLAEIRKMQGR